MAETMIASKKMSNGQVNKLVAKFRAALEKHRPEITSEAAQALVAMPNIGMELFGVLRQRLELIIGLIVRLVVVDLTRTAREAIEATGRKQYCDWSVVEAMPRGQGGQVEVFVFKPQPEAYKDGLLSDEALEREYEFVGLKPADPFTLAALNEVDPAFADQRPNATHWKDATGKWCYAAFYRRDGRRVYVAPRDDDWNDYSWFVGVRK